jgi:membrane protein
VAGFRTQIKRLTNYGAIGAWVRTTRLAPAWALLADIVHVFKRHRAPMLARQAAYSLLFAIPSVVILIVALANLIDRRIDFQLSDSLIELIEDNAPRETQELLVNLVSQALIDTSANRATVALIISIVVAIWGGAGGTGSLILACNVVYDVVDKRNFFIRQSMRFVMTIVQGIVFVASMLFFSIGHRLADWLGEEYGRDGIFVSIISSPRGLAIGLIFISLFLLYGVAPDVRMQYRWLLPGTALATLAVLGLLALIDTLLRFANPSGAYGIAGSVLVVLWILYVFSLVVISGAVINASIGGRYDHKLRTFLAEESDRRIIGRPTFGIPTADQA